MTKEERAEKRKELRKLFHPYFDSIGEDNPYYIPKSIRHEGTEGNTYLACSFFENELTTIGKIGHVYVENVDWRNYERLSKENYKLYKWTFNPYWDDLSEGYEKIVVNSQSGTYNKYAIPFEEFTVVGEGLEFWKGFNKQEELPLFDMSPISGVKPKHEPIDQAAAFEKPQPGLDLSAIEEDGIDTSLLKLTARDLYAITHRKPVSSIPGINEFINKENNG